MSGAVTLLSRLWATDEQAADVLAGRLEAFVRTVPTEPGNLSYAVYRTEEERTLFYIEESWSGAEDAERHARSVGADPTAQQSAALLAAPIETVTLSALGSTGGPDHEGRHHA